MIAENPQSHLSVSDCQRVGLADFDKPLYLLAQRISGGFMIFANVNGSAENIWQGQGWVSWAPNTVVKNIIGQWLLAELSRVEYYIIMSVGSAEYHKIFCNHGCWFSWASQNILWPWLLAQLRFTKYFVTIDVGSAECNKIFWGHGCWFSCVTKYFSSAEHENICGHGCWLSWAAQNILQPWLLVPLSVTKYFVTIGVGSAEHENILWPWLLAQLSCTKYFATMGVVLVQLTVTKYFVTIDVGSAEHENILWPWLLAQLLLVQLSVTKYFVSMDVGSAEHHKIFCVHGCCSAELHKIFCNHGCWFSWALQNILWP